ncbi:MAG: amidohydrolase/deacetylase family metallohydrolase [bacterium]|nr:amidohydrolase/deacetylase family metallohydrolase [bacterium]
MEPRYDLLIQGGTLVDPAQNMHAKRDIAISGDRIAAVEEQIFEEEARTVIDAAGKLITPGLIDLHVHVFWGVSHYGIEPDPTCLARGVTTAFDAGSAGADTFPGFKKYVLDVSATRIRAFLHLSSQGMLSPDVGELTDLRYADVKRAVQMCEQHKNDIVGIKIRLTENLVGQNGKEALKRAREVCEATGLPLMVHPNASPVSLPETLAELRPGDILTHCFHQSETGVIAPDGTVRGEVRKACENGLLLDVGHGQGSFSFAVAESAMAQGLYPGTISSDLHIYNLNGPVHDLATTASKFLLLGLSLDETLDKVTAAPARMMGMLNEIGTLRPGTCADLAILDHQSGTFEFTDSLNETRTGEQKLEPVATIRAGRLYDPRAFASAS